MNRTVPRNADPLAGPARRRPPRTSVRELDLFGAVPDQRSAAAMDDAAEAERLIDDLLALVDCGLVETVDDGGRVRYGPVGFAH